VADHPVVLVEGLVVVFLSEVEVVGQEQERLGDLSLVDQLMLVYGGYFVQV
jgi:hypothetical protein